MPLIQIKSPIEVETGQELRIPFSITDDEAVVPENISARLYPLYLLDLWEAIAAGDYTFTRASSATYVDQDGVIQTALTDVLRASHYVQGERAVLIEGQRTNLVPGGNQRFAGWTAFSGASVTLTQGQAVAEWGATDATRIQTSGGTHVLKYYIDLGSQAAGYESTVSIWVKNTGFVPVVVRNHNAGVQDTVPVGESRFVQLSGVSALTARVELHFMAENAAAALDFIAWRPQIENALFASSSIYDPGGAGAVTRAADAFALTGTWDEQPVTQYERFYDQATGAFADEIHQFTGTQAQVLESFRAYTHVIVAPGTRSIEYMRLLAGVTA